MSKGYFTIEAFRNIREIGSLAESSKYLCGKILRHINFNSDIVILELGAGTGSFTSEILNNLSPNSKLISFEINSKFIEKLSRINNSKFELKKKSALEINSLFKPKSIDYIVSSLPLANLNLKDKQVLLYNISQLLKKEGRFIQFQYSLYSKGVIKKYFPFCKVDVCLRNFPPAFVYYT